MSQHWHVLGPRYGLALHRRRRSHRERFIAKGCGGPVAYDYRLLSDSRRLAFADEHVDEAIPE